LDYNQLKLIILQTIAKAPMDSNTLVAKLGPGKFDLHALRMALMRYYRLGLLKREKSGGAYVYTLSERGLQRLRWLQEQHTED
jgi:DNA-binding transcriptional regulator PaaX